MTETTQLQQVLAPAEDVLMSDSGDKKVLMSMQQGHFIELNPTGRAIWERLDGTKSLGAIAAELAGVYDITAEECRAEVMQFAAALREHSLVDIRD